MSRLRNRNIRTKIHAVAKWSNNFNATTTRVNTQTNGKLFENAGTTTTADSGIAEIVPLAPKLNKLVHTTRTRTRRSNWNLDSAVEESGNESSDEESRNSCSSVDTLKVLDEIRNLEDSVKSMSAESYNSWNEEYENDSTQLVKAEYDRMERVLQCREAIPANYDKEEYKLWIKTFPLLSLVSRTSSLEYRKTSPYDTLEQISTPKFCDTTPSTPAKKNSPVDNILDQLESFTTLKNQLPTHSTTTYTNKYLAINNTINPRTINIADQSFLQLAPVITNNHSSNRRQSFKPSHPREKSNTNCTGRTSDWLKDVHDFNHFRQGKNDYFGTPGSNTRRKSSKTEPLKSSSEFIVLPPIEGKELRSSSAATISQLGKAPILPLGRLKHPPVYPLYENDKESDHNDGFVSFRHRKRKYK